VQYLRLTKTDGAKQQQIFVRPDSILWLQGAAPTALPTPEDAELSGSGAILQLAGGQGHAITVTEPVEAVVRMLEGETQGDFRAR